MSYVVILNKVELNEDDKLHPVELVYGPFDIMESAVDFLDRNDYSMTQTWYFKILELSEPY